MKKYFRIKNYIYALRHILGIRQKPKTNKTPGQRPVFWAGSGGCGFLRTYDLLKTSGQHSVFYKSNHKLQNHNTSSNPDSELIWAKGSDETLRIKKYFKKEGVYDHHIAPYTPPYVPEIVEHFNGKVLFLCLRSPKSVDSLWTQWGYRNPLIADRSRKNRYPVELYPDMRSVATDSKVATQKYWERYYELAEQYQTTYPENFYIIDADKFFSDQEYFSSINDRFDLNLTFKENIPNCESKLTTASLDGGLGNTLFQMAEAVAFCAEHSLPTPQFATWDMANFPQYYRNDRFMGGHSATQGELTRTFPNIAWLPTSPASFDTKFIINDMFSFIDVHHERAAILKYFESSPEVKQGLRKKYPAINTENTVSLHYRTGGQKADTRAFTPITTDWYKQLFSSHFEAGYDCFVFSDNNERAKQLIQELETCTKNRYHLIEEGVFNSLVMMSMCKNHVLSNSTLSFWGAYLDPTQPKGTTILHESFVKYHSEPHIECRMLPYAEWKLL